MAVEISQRVLDMVRHELVQNPDVDNATLYEKARRLDPQAMRDVDRRQFNARYPLRVKRFEMQTRRPKVVREKTSRPRRQTARTAAPVEAPAPAAATVAAARAAPPPAVRSKAKERVRAELLRFAQDLAKAESRGDIVAVVAGVDQYVERILGLGSD